MGPCSADNSSQGPAQNEWPDLVRISNILIFSKVDPTLSRYGNVAELTPPTLHFITDSTNCTDQLQHTHQVYTQYEIYKVPHLLQHHSIEGGNHLNASQLSQLNTLLNIFFLTKCKGIAIHVPGLSLENQG